MTKESDSPSSSRDNSRTQNRFAAIARDQKLSEAAGALAELREREREALSNMKRLRAERLRREAEEAGEVNDSAKSAG